jgi:hypothetical protein
MSIDPKSSYYDIGGIESMDIAKAKAKLTEEQFVGAMLFNVLKYATRCNFKGSFKRDVEKIKVYATLLNEAVNPVEEEEVMPEPSEARPMTLAERSAHILACCSAISAYRHSLEKSNGTDILQGMPEDFEA